MTTTQGQPCASDRSRKAQVVKPRGSTSTLPKAMKRVASAKKATRIAASPRVVTTGTSGLTLRPVTVNARGALALCADCLDRPAPDQRRQAKDGRCRICTRELARAKRKRTAARKEANANQTYVAMYDLSEASSWDGEV